MSVFSLNFRPLVRVVLVVFSVACVASVSVWFRSKERPVLAAREMKRDAKNERGERGRGRKETFFLPNPLPAHLLAPFFGQSLTLVPRSLLLNRTETLATQAIFSSH